MKTGPALPPGSAERAAEAYGDTLFRLCLAALGSVHGAEDAVQETLLKYLQKAPPFESAEHEKAWLIRVAVNQCRDQKRFASRHPQTELDEALAYAPDAESTGIFDALTSLPEKYRVVLTLHYAEGYSTKEIARMIGRTPSAVKMRLQKGRRLLEEAYRKECL